MSCRGVASPAGSTRRAVSIGIPRKCNRHSGEHARLSVTRQVRVFSSHGHNSREHCSWACTLRALMSWPVVSNCKSQVSARAFGPMCLQVLLGKGHQVQGKSAVMMAVENSLTPSRMTQGVFGATSMGNAKHTYRAAHWRITDLYVPVHGVYKLSKGALSVLCEGTCVYAYYCTNRGQPYTYILVTADFPSGYLLSEVSQQISIISI